MRILFIFFLLFSPLFSQDRKPHATEEQLYLSLNIGQGDTLELSDGSTYQIDPEDKLYASYWITPIPIMLSESGNQEYPVKITNLNTGNFVKGKKIDTRKFLQEEYEKRRPMPPQPNESPPQELKKPNEKS